MNKPGPKSATISSTSIDLPVHRREVVDACLRQGVFPIGMEYLPARDADAIRVSLEMVDKADIYIGIFAWRYGHKPEGRDISITEMEFNRAVERKIPILVFLIHKEHPLTIEMVETDRDAQKKLAELKERASNGRGRREFKSPEELRGEVIHALSDLKQRAQESSGQKAAPDFHPPNLIPKAPEPYIAHPYSLLQTKDVVGRQDELNLLTDWVTTNTVVPAGTRIFNLVAIGGMGKSALTWKWFNDIAPNELPKLAGRMWWSFYESDAHWENFIIRALAYVSGQSEKTVREMKSPDREDQLWQILDQQPFLLVLDGLERILLAYARMDAAQMLDEDLDDKTANRVAQAHGLPESAGESFIDKHRLRRAADHRAGQFLRRVSRVTQSQIVITTRLYAAELQTDTGNPLPGCFAKFLTGLTDDDALNLWREFKVSGSSEQLLPLFKSFGNYPLLLRALAGEVATSRNAPGDFDKWREHNPGFDPAGLPLKNAKTHVLEYALRGLGETQRKVLHTVAAFRMPATWDTLRALLVEAGHGLQAVSTRDKKRIVKLAKEGTPKLCADDCALDTVLTELEDRGLIGWDKQANRYDLHPIVRGVVWLTLDRGAQEGIHQNLHAYFSTLPRTEKWRHITAVEDLTPSIELYNTLIGLRRYREAADVFFANLDRATNYRLNASQLRIELLTSLLPRPEDDRSRIEEPSILLDVLAGLGRSWMYVGDLKSARHYLDCGVALSKQSPLLVESSPWCVYSLCQVFNLCGKLYLATKAGESAVERRRKQMDAFEECRATTRLGLAFAACGSAKNSSLVLGRAETIATSLNATYLKAFVSSAKAQCELWFENASEALELALLSWEFSEGSGYERTFIRAARRHGEAALGLGDQAIAEERLHHALTRARAVNLLDEELSAVVGLVELQRRRGQFDYARELLEQVWAPAERGPYPLFHTDALNVLAQIECDQGNRDAALAAATKAYTLAWCDGPPYAYHYGLTNARKHLQELGAPEPQLPPFDESKFEPMPDVELNPKDEFWVDPDKLDSL